MSRTRVFAFSLLSACGLLPCQEPPTTAKPSAKSEAKPTDQELAAAIERYFERESIAKASYGSKGFRLESRDGNFQTNLQWRAQLRFTEPYRSDPRQVDDFESPDERTFEGRRLRMKIGGHG